MTNKRVENILIICAFTLFILFILCVIMFDMYIGAMKAMILYDAHSYYTTIMSSQDSFKRDCVYENKIKDVLS